MESRALLTLGNWALQSLRLLAFQLPTLTAGSQCFPLIARHNTPPCWFHRWFHRGAGRWTSWSEAADKVGQSLRLKVGVSAGRMLCWPLDPMVCITPPSPASDYHPMHPVCTQHFTRLKTVQKNSEHWK